MSHLWVEASKFRSKKRSAVETLMKPGLELKDIAEQMHLPLESGHALWKRSQQSGEVETFLKFYLCSLDLKFVVLWQEIC